MADPPSRSRPAEDVTTTCTPLAAAAAAEDAGADATSRLGTVPAASAVEDETGTTGRSRTSRLISASAIMAAGTLVSRVLGFGRLMLLVVLFGNGSRQIDMFTIANTVPNSMYILLAGGVLNTVLVPQIVRAIRNDRDRGEAYTNRIMTAGLVALALITVALTLAVPLIIRLYTSSGWKTPGLSAQYDSMVMLGYYCMPQIFFYGVHVLAGQVLNARDRFGPMMWAPIANNVVSIGVLLVFLGVFGRGNASGAFTNGEELLLGLGSTLGIAVQAGVLLPFLRAAGFRFRPRFDFRNTGLGTTFRLAKWTLGFVLITQLALVVVNRLASAATVGRGEGAGIAAYYNAYAVWILPHSLITVSLATAMLPAASRAAAAGDLAAVADEVNRAVRLAVTALLPAAVGLVALGLPIAEFAFGFGAGARDAEYPGYALMALALGLVPFTVQYLYLRAFYSLEDTRSTFFLQIVISGINVVVGVSVVALLHRWPGLVATGLALAYAVAYLVGVGVSYQWLHRKLPDLDGRRLVRHCVRLFIAVVPAGLAAFAICWGLEQWSEAKPARLLALAVAGLVAVGIFVGTARLLHLTEVTDLASAVVHRGRSGRGSAAEGPSSESVPDGDSSAVAEADQLTIETAEPTENERLSKAESMSQAAALHTADDEGEDSDHRPYGGADDEGEDSDHRPYGGAEDDDLEDTGPGLTLAVPPKPAPLTAGRVLGQRYRLEELIREASPTVSWRAFDEVLSRSVLIHLLPPADPKSAELLAVARKAAVATDSRFLRVLDAVHSDDDEIGSYVVSEYAIGQSLESILSHGPLSGLEAAWVVREVADALSGVHHLGLYHQRINPDTIIITPTGNVKIVGLLIEAALRPSQSAMVHGADSPEHIDVLDLGRLLYASLVSRWPGGPAFGLPDAPVIGRRWATPRQVRAGVSPALDNLCDQILGDPPRHKATPITTANALVTALTKVLGPADASADLERRLRQPLPRVGSERTAPTIPATSASQATTVVAPVRPPAEDEPTQRHGATAAPTTTIAAPARTSPAGTAGAAGAAAAVRRRGARPPRRWIVLLVLLLVLVVLVGGVLAALRPGFGQKKSPTTGSTRGAPTSQASSSAPPAGAVIPVLGGRDFDPQGDDRTENPTLVKLAYDGDPATGWMTLQYRGNPKLGGIKRGVGLVFDLGSAQSVRTVSVNLRGTGTSLELRVPKTDPTTITTPPMRSDSLWRSVATQSEAGSVTTLTAEQPVTTRFVLVYLTSLPKEGSSYRGGIDEVEVKS